MESGQNRQLAEMTTPASSVLSDEILPDADVPVESSDVVVPSASSKVCLMTLKPYISGHQ
ncbi:MAG: hypothetical protein ACE5OZ_23125 [Candidatus Heimdallarchaeota archaeon]